MFKITVTHDGEILGDGDDRMFRATIDPPVRDLAYVAGFDRDGAIRAASTIVLDELRRILAYNGPAALPPGLFEVVDGMAGG